MDVNELLKRIREDVARFQRADTYEEEGAAGALLAERVSALDEWLSGGGYLPSDWSQIKVGSITRSRS